MASFTTPRYLTVSLFQSVGFSNFKKPLTQTVVLADFRDGHFFTPMSIVSLSTDIMRLTTPQAGTRCGTRLEYYYLRSLFSTLSNNIFLHESTTGLQKGPKMLASV